MVGTGKTHRNEQCPCGSGLKYKKCCLTRQFNAAISATRLPPDAVRKQERVVQEVRNRITNYGHVRPIIQADWKGKKWIAVGEQLYASDRWKTFLDFLFDHIIHVLGREWAQAELRKAPDARHPILNWYVKTYEVQTEASQSKGADGIFKLRASGPAAAFFNLAYDLYVLRHHQSLLKKVVQRLKNRDQFQGARYELFVTATCIRGGFDITHEDESDNTRRHPEFLATHRITGQRLWVEAKSKHRAGVLGHAGAAAPVEPRAGVKWLLSDAADKAPDGPYAVFVDVNLPPSTAPVLQTSWCRECLDTFCDLGDVQSNSTEPFNLCIFTNHPHHYGDQCELDPPVAIFAKQPKHAVLHPEALGELFKAAELYGRIPSAFPPS